MGPDRFAAGANDRSRPKRSSHVKSTQNVRNPLADQVIPEREGAQKIWTAKVRMPGLPGADPSLSSASGDWETRLEVRVESHERAPGRPSGPAEDQSGSYASKAASSPAWASARRPSFIQSCTSSLHRTFASCSVAAAALPAPSGLSIDIRRRSSCAEPRTDCWTHKPTRRGADVSNARGVWPGPGGPDRWTGCALLAGRPVQRSRKR